MVIYFLDALSLAMTPVTGKDLARSRHASKVGTIRSISSKNNILLKIWEFMIFQIRVLIIDTLQWNWLLSKKFRSLQIGSREIINGGKNLLTKLGVLSLDSSLSGSFCIPRQSCNTSRCFPLFVASIPKISKKMRTTSRAL